MPMGSLSASVLAPAAAGTRAWLGRALLVLGLSLAVHATVLVVGHKTLQTPTIEYGHSGLIEVTLQRQAVAEPAAEPKAAQSPRRTAKVPLAPREAPPPPVVESVPSPSPESALVETQPPAAPVEAASVSSAESERLPPQAEATVGEFDASGGTLLEEVERPPLQRAALPVSARYVYQTTDTRFSAVTGTTTVHWRFEDDRSYAANLVTTVFGLTVLELNSQGHVQRFGLAPDRYTEKTVGRSEWATNFDWSARRLTFSAKSHERELREGIQDRLSFQFQLMALGQRLPSRFRPGGSILLAVGGRDDISAYRFDIIGSERLQTAAGEFETVKLERPKSADGRDSRIEVWLAPDAAWLPVKLRFTDRRDQVTENSLSEIVIPAQ
jgi:hypothetical protein